MSFRAPRGVENPWQATTLEWQTASPPPHGNFAGLPSVDRGPYEYGVVDDAADDFHAQGQVIPANAEALELAARRWRLEPRTDTGTTNGALGMWLFLASEVMLFGGLFSAYVLLRGGAASWPSGADLFGWPGAVVGTVLLAVASRALNGDGSNFADSGERNYTRPLSVLCGILFLAVQAFEWSAALGAGITPRSSVFAGLFFTITGVHGLHVAAVVAAMLWTNVNRRLLRYYWWLVDLVWIGIVVGFHV